MIRIITAVAALVVALALAPAAASADDQLAWKSCIKGDGDELGKKLDEVGARCARLSVPLDYANPGGRTIEIAISRLEATDRERRIGTLFGNTGGPGGTERDVPLLFPAHMKDVAKRYDIVGVDLRGTGESTGIDCKHDSGHPIRSAGTDRRAFDRMVAAARDFAERCKRTHGDLLPYINTPNIARDFDAVRAALGEQKISYVGYSYGTYLGAVYSQLFPGRLDRVVLDSAIDPAEHGVPSLLIDSIEENERALAGWAKWAAERDATYGLGATRRAVLRTIDRVVRAAARRPLEVGPFRVDEHVAPRLQWDYVGDDRDRARDVYARALRALDEAARTGQRVEGTPELNAALTFITTSASSAFSSAQAAIFCGDRVQVRDPEQAWRDVQRSRKRHPLFGPLAHNVYPCTFWPEPREPEVRIGNATPALIVNATGDTRTPYDNAKVLHRLLSESRLLTLRGATIHAVYGFYGNACVDRKVNAYLASGVLPRRDERCTS